MISTLEFGAILPIIIVWAATLGRRRLAVPIIISAITAWLVWSLFAPPFIF